MVITAALYALVFFTSGSTTPKLGIDLQGGTRVTLTARTSDGSNPSGESMSLARTIMERRVNGSGVSGAQVQVDGDRQLVITVPGQDEDLLQGLTRSARLNVRSVITQWVNPGYSGPVDFDDLDAMEEAALAETDVDPLAGEEPPADIFPEGSDPEVLVQPAGTTEADFDAWQAEAATYAQTGASPTCTQIDYFQGLDDPDKPLIACDEEGLFVYLLEPTLIPGTEIKEATSHFDGQNGGWIINVTFHQNGFRTWSSYTTGHVGTQTAFTLDSQVLSAPSIRQPITTATTTVSGNFTQDSSKALADSLKFGALPLAFDRQESAQVSAELGSQYLKAGLIAGGVGLILVILYCLIYYRLLGIVTILSLVLAAGLIYATMVLLGRWIGLSLDMAGIAGLIIAIGITADSFVVYFERIKDEVREGRTFRSSVPRGWARAKRTILSADAVTLLSAVILYVLAVGDVKGFAFTLGLSTLLDLVVVFLVTHPLVALISHRKVFSSPLWSGLGSVARAGAQQRAASAHLQVKGA